MEKKLRIAIPGDEEGTPNYREALRLLDAEPVLVGMECQAEEFDGLLLPGGGDVDPSRFGQEDQGSNPSDLELDELQFTVLDRFVKAKKPVLGICRGHQVINIYFGGTLIQDLGEERNMRHRSPNVDKVHPVRTDLHSWLGRLYGEHFIVNSAHHQSVDQPGRGLRVISWSEEGVAEALEHESLPVYGVQWHPERLCFSKRREDAVDGSHVLKLFLEAAEDGRSRK